MCEHLDTLSELNKYTPLREKLIVTHKSVGECFPFIARIAIAIYDPETTIFKPSCTVVAKINLRSISKPC
ncbi:MAG: hypothetical protein ACI88A_002758 [Paraglaciecola sp.]|jgi:hypothetical protein